MLLEIRQISVAVEEDLEFGLNESPIYIEN
jgi:hypothetical protein